jgi:hypothetical protein
LYTLFLIFETLVRSGGLDILQLPISENAAIKRNVAVEPRLGNWEVADS